VLYSELKAVPFLSVELSLGCTQEYCNGGSLDSALNKGLLHSSGPLGRNAGAVALRILQQVADGMAHLQMLGISHGRLGPRSVLFKVHMIPPVCAYSITTVLVRILYEGADSGHVFIDKPSTIY
jgi:hypothetical protein